MKSIKRPVITVLNYKVAWFPERTMPKREGQATVAIQAGLPRIKPGLLTNNQRNNRLIGLYPGASSAAAGAGSTALQTSAPTGGTH